MPPQHTIILKNGLKLFTTFSNYEQRLVYPSSVVIRPWKRVIFLLHGFPDNHETFNEVWDLILNSYQNEPVLLLAPALRGYEPSSFADSDKEYHTIDIAGDVKSWISSIVPEDEHENIPVHLVGHDWGACVSFQTANLYPELITLMVTMAIPYCVNLGVWEYLLYAPMQVYCSSYFFTMQFASMYRPRFAMTETGKNSYLDKLYRYWSPKWDYTEADIGSVRNTLNTKGVIDAVTAYYRCFISLRTLSNRWYVDFNKVPTLILGGADDGCMHKLLWEYEAKKLAGVSNVKVTLLKGLGHFLHREDPKKVADHITDWLQIHA
ncbi:uncharacterized protein KQ657_001099 [Scheffersomyces spartinae]|uniref:AB hydrolase-1 domain-containing protein n=1 Tax=Scheffersomyces spartinae TaxID=45513 RepID=A0A9P8AHS2_9ASCO|nr:uncharacterized protein KQ657_001099 [Scheffersomyces spartinae]KAG7192989.1 hypothetical protein KQ657_001099 [Scheffersomyces spartinae]